MAVQALQQAEELFQNSLARAPGMALSLGDIKALEFMYVRAQAYAAVAHNQGWPVETVR